MPAIAVKPLQIDPLDSEARAGGNQDDQVGALRLPFATKRLRLTPFRVLVSRLKIDLPSSAT
jgi:hypothetical protein